MDKATFLGFFGSVGLCFFCMYSGAGGDMMAYWSFSAFILVLFGSLTCTMMSVPMSSFMNGVRVTAKCFVYKEERDLVEVVQEMVEYATTARQDGLLALENELMDLSDPFLSEGLRMVIDGQKPDEVEVNLRLKLLSMGNRHTQGKKFYEIMGVYSPAYGLLTTIIGQVVMFKNMGTDISAIGSGMAVALLGTLYGSLLSNLVCLPFADKLDVRSKQEQLQKELQIQGILAIASESSPTMLKQQLLAFLDQKQSQKVDAS